MMSYSGSRVRENGAQASRSWGQSLSWAWTCLDLRLNFKFSLHSYYLLPFTFQWLLWLFLLKFLPFPPLNDRAQSWINYSRVQPASYLQHSVLQFMCPSIPMCLHSRVASAGCVCHWLRGTSWHACTAGKACASQTLCRLQIPLRVSGQPLVVGGKEWGWGEIQKPLNLYPPLIKSAYLYF